MSRLLYRLGRGAALHPWRTLGLWVLTAALVFGLASVAGGKPHDDWDVPGARHWRHAIRPDAQLQRYNAV